MQSTRPEPNEVSISNLRSELKGRVIGPGDEGYDAARTIFYGGFDRKPSAIVRVADAQDVSRAVSLAEESGVDLAVRSGGHSPAGHGVIDEGIMIDLGDMKGIDIDVQDRTVWAETGLTAGEFTTATGVHGLATGFGDAGSVGIGGITLAGGVGYLVRKYGMTIDDLLSAEIVTADGEILQIDEGSHPDLFWAIRGGGGNFGVATRLKFRLHEVDQIVGGMLMLPATPDVIASVVAEAESASEELSMMVNVMKAPPMPFIPEEFHGRLIVLIMLAHAGSIEEGERTAGLLRKLAPPIADMVRPIRFPEIYPPEQEGFHPVASLRTGFAEDFGRDQAASIIEHIEASTAPMVATQLRVLGGAMARVPVEATAFAHRTRPLMANVAAMYEDPDEREQHDAWVAALSAIVTGGEPGAYTGFLDGNGAGRIGEAYPGRTWDRLVEVKRRYDPTNLFRRNHNISPDGGV